MTFAAVGSFFQATASTFTLTPAAVGDLILVEVLNTTNNTVYASSLASSNVTWVTLGHYLGVSDTSRAATLFSGTVTAASSATVTVTWSGTAPANIRIAGQEFSSTLGGWALDKSGHIDTATGTNTWASLTPAGAGELYFGFTNDIGTATAGTTSGYTYDVDVHSNGMAFNPACTSAAQAPVWGDSGSSLGMMVLVQEVAGTTSISSSDAVAAADGTVTGGAASGSSVPGLTVPGLAVPGSPGSSGAGPQNYSSGDIGIPGGRYWVYN